MSLHNFQDPSFWMNSTNGHEIARGIVGGTVLSVLITLGILFIFALLIALYFYTSIAWRDIARKLKYKKSWLAWIPIANISMMLQLGGFAWGWVFLILIPILGWAALFVLIVISTWRIFEKKKYPGWWSLSMVIPKVGAILYFIAIGVVAWKDKGRIAEEKKKKRR